MTTTTAPVLSREQVRHFEEQGFLVLERLTAGAELDRLSEVYDRLFDPDGPVAAQDRVELGGDAERTLPQVLDPHRYAPELLETAAFRHATAVAGQLLGVGCELMGTHAIRKAARSEAVTPWHQDEAYWDPAYRHPALSIWVPLQPATADNGCMHFLPGSHLGEVRPHQLVDPGNADGLRLADGEQVTGGVACPLPAGGATVHAGRTVHSTGPNRTDEPRRALVLAFRRPPEWEGRRSFPWQPASWYEAG